MKRSVETVDFLAQESSDFETATELLIYSANKNLKPIKVEFEGPSIELKYNKEDGTMSFTMPPEYCERLIQEVLQKGFTITVSDNGTT